MAATQVMRSLMDLTAGITGTGQRRRRGCRPMPRDRGAGLLPYHDPSTILPPRPVWSMALCIRFVGSVPPVSWDQRHNAANTGTQWQRQAAPGLRPLPLRGSRLTRLS